MALSDADLMLLVQEGDEEAFVEIITRYEKRLINFFYRLGWDYHLSEDLAQEVFMRIYRYRKKYRETAKFQTFIFRIAKNLWIDQIRKRHSRPSPISLEKEVGGKEDAGVLRDFIKDDRIAAPSAAMERDDLSGAIMDAVATLNEQEQLIFMMVSSEGLKYREIAEILEIPEGTVKSKVYYTYRKLRDKLEEYDPDGM